MRHANHIEANDPKFFALRQYVIRIGLIWALLSLIAWAQFGESALIWSLIALGGLVIALQLHLYHKMQIENFHHYKQVEALFALYNAVELPQPIPAMRLWAASPDLLTIIAAQIQQHRPEMILELGSGVSTLVSGHLLKSLGTGKLISLEHEAGFAAISTARVEAHGLAEYASVVHTPLTSVALKEGAWQWYDVTHIPKIRSIDLLVVDGPPEGLQKRSRYPALPMLFDRLAQGAIIIVDDFMRPDEHAMVAQWLADYALDVVEVVDNEKGAIILRKR